MKPSCHKNKGHNCRHVPGQEVVCAYVCRYGFLVVSLAIYIFLITSYWTSYVPRHAVVCISAIFSKWPGMQLWPYRYVRQYRDQPNQISQYINHISHVYYQLSHICMHVDQPTVMLISLDQTISVDSHIFSSAAKSDQQFNTDTQIRGTQRECTT